MTQFKLAQIAANKFHVLNLTDNSIVGSVSVSSPEEVSDLLRHWSGPTDRSQSQKPSVSNALMAAFKKQKPMSKAALMRGCC
jgi:hypothetical protein